MECSVVSCQGVELQTSFAYSWSYLKKIAQTERFCRFPYLKKAFERVPTNV